MKPVVGPVSIGDSEIQINKNQYTLKYNNEIKNLIYKFGTFYIVF